MSNLKVLNIDALIKPTRALEIGGQEHIIQELSVENFLETSAALKVLEAGSVGDIAAQVESTIDMILRSVPTCPRDALVKIPLGKLQDIVSFVRGDDIVPEVVDTVAPEKAGKKTSARK